MAIFEEILRYAQNDNAEIRSEWHYCHPEERSDEGSEKETITQRL